MKKNILLMLALLTLGAQNIRAEETMVNLVNWSSNYNIAVLSASGKWVQIPPKTIIKNVKMFLGQGIQVRACDKSSKTCGFSSKGDFTWNGQDFTTLKYLGKFPDDMLVFDAGYSFFSGLDLPEYSQLNDQKRISTTKTIRVISLSSKTAQQTITSKILQSVKVGTIATPKTAQEPKATATYATKAQFDAVKATLDAKAIIGLSEKEMYWLFGLDPKGTPTNPTISNEELMSHKDGINKAYRTQSLNYNTNKKSTEATEAFRKVSNFYNMLQQRMK